MKCGIPATRRHCPGFHQSEVEDARKRAYGYDHFAFPRGAERSQAKLAPISGLISASNGTRVGHVLTTVAVPSSPCNHLAGSPKPKSITTRLPSTRRLAACSAAPGARPARIALNTWCTHGQPFGEWRT